MNISKALNQIKLCLFLIISSTNFNLLAQQTAADIEYAWSIFYLVIFSPLLFIQYLGSNPMWILVGIGFVLLNKSCDNHKEHLKNNYDDEYYF